MIQDNQLEVKIGTDKFLNINLYEIRIEDSIIYNSDLLKILFFDCQCCLYIIDLANSKTFDPVKELISIIDQSKFPDLKSILVANKSDIKKENDNIKEFINKKKNIEYIEISIKNGTNVENLIKKIDTAVNSKNNDFPINQVSCYLNNINYSQKMKFKGSISLILIGNSGVGKSNLMRRYDNKKFENLFLSTIGYNDIIKIIKIDNKDYYKLTLWDTAGQERFQCMPPKYYKKADGILLLFDINDRNSFNDVSKWMEEINDNVGTQENILIYLIANKIDYLQEEKRIISNEEIIDLAEKLKIKYFEVSCKWNMNIEEMMARIVLDCSKNLKSMKYEDNIKINKMRSRNNSGCC